MFPITLDPINLILILIAGIIGLLSLAFPAPIKEIGLSVAVGLFLIAAIRSIFLALRRDTGNPLKPKENAPPNKFQQTTEQLKLRQAIKLIKSGDKNGGRDVLTDIVASNPDNEEAWLWLASVVPSDKRAFCLQNTLRINPNNVEAKQYLDKLKSMGPNE